MIIAYIAHPVGGDVRGNLEKVRLILRDINLTESNVVPFAPYWVDCHALDDAIPAERTRGIANNKEFFYRGMIDELRLYGDKISSGMQSEIKLAQDLGIPIIICSEGVAKDAMAFGLDLKLNPIESENELPL